MIKSFLRGLTFLAVLVGIVATTVPASADIPQLVGPYFNQVAGCLYVGSGQPAPFTFGTQSLFVPLQCNNQGQLLTNATGGGGSSAPFAGGATGVANAANQGFALFGNNGTTNDALREGGINADGLATVTTGAIYNLSFNMGWNGTTWDRIKSTNGAMNVATDGTKITAATLGAGGAGTIGWLSQIANALANTLNVNVTNTVTVTPGGECKVLGKITTSGNTVIKASGGFFCGYKNLDTATAQPAVTCYDNATTNTGNIFEADTLQAGSGSMFPVPLQSTNGITCNAASAPTAAGVNVYGS